MVGSPRVSFLIAGVQKGGTTALFDYLGDEPGVGLSTVKETHFFDEDERDWDHPDYAAYHAFFPAGGERVLGEATPSYLYWPGALERISAYNPAMKLIVLLRDPVERAWSHWKMEYARGVERQPFAWCIRQGRQRLFDADPWGFHREFSYVERGYYAQQLDHLLGLFPRSQLLALRSQDLEAEPGRAMAQVRRFLGLPPGADPGPRRVHESRAMDYGSTLRPQDIEHLKGIYAADQERLKALAGFDFLD